MSAAARQPFLVVTAGVDPYVAVSILEGSNIVHLISTAEGTQAALCGVGKGQEFYDRYPSPAAPGHGCRKCYLIAAQQQAGRQ